MAQCDFDGRPAVAQVTVSENGERRVINLCDEHYQEFMARRGRNRGLGRSPLESLFGGGSLFDRLMDDSWSPFGDMDGARGGGRGGTGAAETGGGGGGRRGARQGGARPALARSGGPAVVPVAKRRWSACRRRRRRRSSSARNEVDTEHLLLALDGQSTSCRTSCASLKLSPEDLKREIEEKRAARRVQGRPRAAQVQMGVSPRAKSALEHALIASRELGHSYVGPEHILIGLVEEEDGFAGEMLRKYGLSPQALRQKTVKVVGKGAEEGKVARAAARRTSTSTARDLTELARQGKLDPVIGRAKEIETTIEVLARRKKNNPVLIGEPGVGKTAIVEGPRAADRPGPGARGAARQARWSSSTSTAWSPARSIAASSRSGSSRCSTRSSRNQNELIIFIDELHTIVGAGQGGGEGGLDIANTFKPALARGELHLIGATTLNEYQKHIEKDAALERRFQPVMVAEPSVEETIEILRGLRDRFEAHHKVKITEEAIEAAAKLSRPLHHAALPAGQGDRPDRPGGGARAHHRPARVRLNCTTSRRASAALKQEQDAAGTAKQYDKAKQLDERIKDRARRSSRARPTQWKKQRGTSSPEVTREHIAEIVSALTGIPVADLTTEERKKLLQLEDRLRERVVGQDEAVHAVSEAVRLARAGLKEPGKPIATFLFLGPDRRRQDRAREGARRARCSATRTRWCAST